MNVDLQQQLLTSIQEQRLLLFCGAGLSRSAPSPVPGAVDLALECSAKYSLTALPKRLPAGGDKDLEILCDFFLANNEKEFFIDKLVDWGPFRKCPNKGHVAAADLLTCGALRSAVTTNFDELIELGAKGLGEDDFQAALNLESANRDLPHRPLLKIHGCVRDRYHTLWCKRQLDASLNPMPATEKEIQSRLASCKSWLAANVVGRDIVFVGFWSDWAYLTPILAETLTGLRPSRVVLVDPADAAYLSTKAPELWKWAHGTDFHHECATGADFLDDLRLVFAENLMTRILNEGRASFLALNPGGVAPDPSFLGFTNDDLFALRRDAFGVPAESVPRMFRPERSMEGVGRVHLRLRNAGASPDGRYYKLKNGEKVRVVNGNTDLLCLVKAKFLNEPPLAPGLTEDYVICVGALDDGGTAASVARPSTPASIVRSGITAEWITEAMAADRSFI